MLTPALLALFEPAFASHPSKQDSRRRKRSDSLSGTEDLGIAAQQDGTAIARRRIELFWLQVYEFVGPNMAIVRLGRSTFEGDAAALHCRGFAANVSGDRDIILRAARSEDLAALRAVLYDTFESTWRPSITDAAAQAFIDEDRPAQYVGARGLRFWVAEAAGEVAGFVDLEDDFVNALHVRLSHARHGIGRRLMDHAEVLIAQAGFGAARLETDTFNRRSQAFYATRGYREVERYPDQEWKSGLTTILLVSPLF